MSYKSHRLLHEAINKEMEELRKFLMATAEVEAGDETSVGRLNDLRKLVDELAAMAARPSIDDVVKMSPGEYVTTMKPLVGNYHRQLMIADRLAQCLCEDLSANAAVVMLIGDSKTTIKTAHNPDIPQAALAVEAILESVDLGTKQIVSAGVEVMEQAAGLPPSAANDPPVVEDLPPTETTEGG